jgi:DNA gyrase subunit A
MSAYKITSLQAQSLCKMPLSSFTKEAHLRYIKEKEDTDDKVEKYSKIVRSVKKIDKIIREELEEGIKLFGEERRSKIITIDGEMKIRDTLHRVLFTKEGFVKKLPENVTTIGFINNNDFPIEFLFVKNTTDLLIFDESGKISKLPIHQLPNSELNKEGEKLSKYCTINGDIKAIIPKPTEESLLELWEKYKTYTYFLMITKKGIIKKTAASQFTNIKNGLIGMITKDNDAFKEVKLLAGDKDVLIYTSKGFGIRMPTTDIKETSRMSQGVKAIELSDGEEVIGMDIINNNDKYLFALTNKGTGKKSPLNTFPVMERNSKPLRIISLEDEEYISAIKTVKGNEEFQAFLKNNSETIKIEDVIELPRLSKGRKLIPVKKGELIIDVKEIKKG